MDPLAELAAFEWIVPEPGTSIPWAVVRKVHRNTRGDTPSAAGTRTTRLTPYPQKWGVSRGNVDT